MKKKRKISAWNKVFGAKLKLCAGTGTQAQYDKASKAYVKSSKDPAKAQKSVDKLSKKACRIR